MPLKSGYSNDVISSSINKSVHEGYPQRQADRQPFPDGGGVFHTRVSTATDPGKAAGSLVKALLDGRPAADATASGGAVENLGRALGIAQKFAAAHGKRLQVRAEISFAEERNFRS